MFMPGECLCILPIVLYVPDLDEEVRGASHYVRTVTVAFSVPVPRHPS